MLLTEKECLQYRADLLGKFSDLKFDEPSHTYQLDGEPLKSVSKLIEYFHEPFDQLGQATAYAERYGFTPQQVISAWEGHALLSQIKGHRVHNFAENWINFQFFEKNKEIPIPTCLQELGVIQWYNDNVFKYDFFFPLIMELKMFSRQFKYAGTADIIILDRRDGSLIVQDWKTNVDIFKKAYSNMIQEGFFQYPDQPFYHYVLQFSFYTIMLREMGYNVKSRVLIWLNKDEQLKKLYRYWKTPDVTENLKIFLNKKIHLQ